MTTRRRGSDWTRGALLGAILLQSGCALITAPRYDDVMQPPAVSLDDVPFHPQKRYQCGPAALATVLEHAGEPVSPDELVDEVYLPARQGSLQPEMITAVRRRGRIGYVSEGDVGALDDVLHAGVPALVLLNLSSRWLPSWHYAVVTGFEADRHRVIMRSGRDPDRRMSWWRFERAWFLGNYWALMVLPDDELPDFVEPVRYLQAVAPWERTDPDRARTAYGRAVARWPDQAPPWVALGNLEAAGDHPRAALAAYAEALAAEPTHPIAANNAADQLGRIGCSAIGLELIEPLLDSPTAARWQSALRATADELAGGANDGRDCAQWRQRLAR